MEAKETEVIMIRHAQSEWNRAGRFIGWADSPLTDLDGPQ
jgi:broad specificity phosphatase PhoE